MKTSTIRYDVGGTTFEGYLAAGSDGRPTPGILVAHEGTGLVDYPRERARMLARDGYVAFAMDIFGVPITSREQTMGLIGGLMGDLPTLRARTRAALEALRAHPQVRPDMLGAIGFCFGGATVLELARSGADVACVTAFHGQLRTTAPEDARNVTARILACVGADDPIIPPDQRQAFVEEMTAGGVDWQMLLLGGVGHSFSNPAATGQIPGFNFDPVADRRAWSAMHAMLSECFGDEARRPACLTIATEATGDPSS